MDYVYQTDNDDDDDGYEADVDEDYQPAEDEVETDGNSHPILREVIIELKRLARNLSHRVFRWKIGSVSNWHMFLKILKLNL